MRKLGNVVNSGVEFLVGPGEREQEVGVLNFMRQIFNIQEERHERSIVKYFWIIIVIIACFFISHLYLISKVNPYYMNYST